MASVRTDNVNIKLDIDGSQSKTELDNLTRKSQVLQQELKGLKKGTQEYIDKNKEISQNTARIEELRKEIGITALSMNQLKTLSGQLSRELAGLSPGTASFVEKSKQLVEVNNRLDQVRKLAKGIDEELDNAGNGFLDFVKKSATFVGISIGIQEAVSALKQLGSESIDAAKKGSDSISDMEKSLNVTTEGAKALREQLADIDTRTAQEDLEGIAIAGGQLGVAAEDVDEFTASVDQANVALGDEFTGGVGEITKSIGGLQKLFKETADQKPDVAINKIGSALNALGADGSATSPVIAEFTARIGQLGDLAPEITQTLGLGAAFQELGLSAEISSGGVTNVLLTASKETEKFSKQLGLTEKEFRNLLNSDPNEVLLRLAESLRGASNTTIVSTLDSLGIKSQEATKVVSLLSTQTDIVRQKQQLANVEFQKGTSLTDEFAKKNTNAAAEVEKAEKAFATYRRELGEQLLPIYIRVLQFTGLVLDVLKATPKFVYDNRAAFLLLALAVLAWNKELIVARASALQKLVVDKLAELQITNLATAQARLNAAMAANPIGAVLVVVALLLFGLKQLYERSESFRAAVDGLWNALKPLGEELANLWRSMTTTGGLLTGLGESFKKMFAAIGGGKAVLEFISTSFRFSLVVPLQLIVTQITLTVDAFMGLWDVGKRVANFFGGDFQVDPNGSFSKLAENFKRNSSIIGDTISGADTAKAAQKAGEERVLAYQKEIEQKMRLAVEAENKRKAAEKQAAADRARQAQAEADAAAAAAAERAKKDLAESFKQREIALQRQLLSVKENSAQELKLKKQLVLLAQEQELSDETKTAAQRVTIRAKTQLELDKLNKAYQAKQAELAKQQAEVEAAAAADIEKRKTALIRDEYERRATELRQSAVAEAAKLKGTEAQVAEARRLINEQLNRDLEALAKERGEKEAQVLREIEQLDADTAVRRAQRAGARANETAGPLAGSGADEQERAARLVALQLATEDELRNTSLTTNEKLAIIRKFHEDKAALDDEFEGRDRQRIQDGLAFTLETSQQLLGSLSDFQKLESDKQLTQLEKDKKAKLKKLDEEYKAGRVSKEEFEKQKTDIETNYDGKSRSIKRAAARDEKAANIASSIMAGVLAVVKAAPNVPLQIATGILAALSTAKIIATPIPEFAKGGVVGSMWRGAKQSVGQAYRSMRTYASGGRINPLGGVADVGQRHGDGGIQMVDGKTGEHLGEWERGEAYMILSRSTVQNNGDLINDLLDTSMYRGGQRVRPRGNVYAEDGAIVGDAPTVARQAAGSQAEVVQAIDRQTAVLRESLNRPMVGIINWGQEDDVYLEGRLDDRAAVRDSFTG